MSTSTRAGSGRGCKSNPEPLSCQYGLASTSGSVVRRPFIFRRSFALLRLSRLEPLRHFFDTRAQCSNFLLLSKNHVAQFSVRSFEKRNLGLDLLQRFIVHVNATQVPQNVCSTLSSGSGGLA